MCSAHDPLERITMPIPPMSREALLEAMQRFSRGERSPWGPQPGENWLGNYCYQYALVLETSRYPVTEIIRLAVHTATGDWRNNIVGGSQANAYLGTYGFQVVELS